MGRRSFVVSVVVGIWPSLSSRRRRPSEAPRSGGLPDCYLMDRGGPDAFDEPSFKHCVPWAM